MLDLGSKRYRHSKYAYIRALVPERNRVLDIGCGSGVVGRILCEKGCLIDGVERDPRAASEAEPWYRRLISGDVEQDGTLQLLNESYDVVILADVLEHLVNPGRVLERLKGWIRPDGVLLACLPNVAHWRVRLGLLVGRFDYAAEGILDRTHLHFYTRRTARELLRGAGYKIVREQATWVMVGWKGHVLEALTALVPTLFADQFFLTAVRAER